MKYVNYVLFLTLFVISSCSDDEVVFDCAGATSDLQSSDFLIQLTVYTLATEMGDTTYAQPSDWGTNCNAYKASMQELLDEGCFAAEDSVTQADIDGITIWCNM